MRNALVWISADAQRCLLREAQAKHPYETGGVLLGYWASAGAQAVVRRIVGPGPDALHTKTHFTPDQDYQEAEIGRVYAETAGVETYLGDWHTHPGDQTVSLSGADKATMRRIARYVDARAVHPVMMILGGGPEEWVVRAWVGQLTSVWPWKPIRAHSAEVRPYDPHATGHR